MAPVCSSELLPSHEFVWYFKKQKPTFLSGTLDLLVRIVGNDGVWDDRDLKVAGVRFSVVSIEVSHFPARALMPSSSNPFVRSPIETFVEI